VTSIGRKQWFVAIIVDHGKLNIGDAKPVSRRIMPTYEYRCPLCNLQMELELPMEHDLVRWQDCGAQANRIYSAPGLVFKGKGFYRTDNA